MGAVSVEQQQIVDWLAGKKQVHVEAPGTDLTMSIEGRVFVNSDGKRNFPAVRSSRRRVDDTVEGNITFSYPGVVQRTDRPGSKTDIQEWRGNGF